MKFVCSTVKEVHCHGLPFYVFFFGKKLNTKGDNNLKTSVVWHDYQREGRQGKYFWQK